MSTNRSLAATVGALLCLVIAGLVVTSSLERTLDLDPWDEGYYLASGLHLTDDGLPNADTGPLYSLWYRVLAVFRSDPVDTFYLNCRLLTILPPLLVFIILRLCRLGIPASVGLAAFVLFSWGNLYAWPKVSGLVLVTALLALVIARLSRQLPTRLSSLTLIGLAAALIRPEYMLTFGVMVFASFVWVTRNRRVGWTGVGALLVPLAASIVVFSTMGVPGLGSRGERGLLAFGQHFAVRWVSWHASKLDPWYQWREVLSLAFGPVQSLRDVIVADPLAILRHTADNVSELPLATLAALQVMPRTTAHPLFWFNLLRLLLPLAVVVFAIRAAVHTHNHQPSRARMDWVMFLGFASFCLPGAVSAVFLFPREHYLVVPAILGVVLVASLVAIQHADGQSQRSSHALTVGLLAVGASFALVPRAEPLLVNARTVCHLRSLQLEGDVFMCSAAGNLCVYSGTNFHYIPIASTIEGVCEAATNPATNVIIPGEHIAAYPSSQVDVWQVLSSECDLQGFEWIVVPGTTRVLFVRTSGIEPRGHHG